MFLPEYCTARKVDQLYQERIVAGKEISPAKNEAISGAASSRKKN
jgi:hypothetical protein